MVRQRLVVNTLGSWIFVKRDDWAWKVRPDGTGLVRVSPSSAGPRAVFEVGLEWSANGEWLLACDADWIYLVHVATGDVVPLGAATTQDALDLRRRAVAT